MKFLQFFAVAAMLTMCFAACSDKDEDTGSSNNNPLSASLVGSWYGEYVAKGETTQGTNSIAGTYIKAVQGLTFNADGTGTCTKFLCNVASEPLSIYGGQMDQSNGRFHYTSNADGTVNITRDGDGNDANPKTWTMKLADGVLSGTDGGTAFQLTTADEFQKAALTDWEKILRDGDNGDMNNKSFLTDWPRTEKVYISGISEPQYLPWAANNPAKSDIPEYILMDMNPADGWEMAFCYLSDPGAQKTRYFGLYNRYRGVLRVYMYIPDAAAYGNEMAFNIACGTSGNIRYPFYNAMDYCIPTRNAYDDWDKNVQLVTGTSKYSPLSWCQTPYTEKTEANGVSAYWHCFDIDMSGYSPNLAEDVKPWRSHVDDNRELLSITPISQNTTQIKLTGTLLGKMDGTLDVTTEMNSASCNPDLHRARVAMGVIGGIFGGIVGAWDNGASVAGWGDDNDGRWAVKLGLAGLLFNTVGAILEDSDDTETKPHTTGTIDMKLNADIDISGVMSGWKSLSDGGLRLTPALLNATNPKCHIGEGCIGLEDAPVVWISEEDLLSEYDHATLVSDGTNYTYKTDESDLRFVAFLDPTTVKINLNPKVYTNIRNLTVTSFTGVNAARSVGYTDSYRDLVRLNGRSWIDLGEGKIELSTTTGKIKLTTLSAEELMDDDPLCNPDGEGVTEEIKKVALPQLVEQKGDEIYRYYGPTVQVAGSQLVLVPQAYLPFKDDCLKQPAAPDFIVGVIVRFDCDQMKGVTMIKQYIPEYKLATHEGLKELYAKMKDYSDKSKNKQQVGTLANDTSVPVYDYNGHIFMNWTLKMLKEVTSK